jgi:hypothetical protein
VIVILPSYNITVDTLLHYSLCNNREPSFPRRRKSANLFYFSFFKLEKLVKVGGKSKSGRFYSGFAPSLLSPLGERARVSGVAMLLLTSCKTLPHPQPLWVKQLAIQLSTIKPCKSLVIPEGEGSKVPLPRGEGLG